MDMVCIVCPNGCRLQVDKTDGGVTVQGARCKRGENFAISELTCPMRSVTSSVRTTVDGYPVVSVRTDGEIPKDKMFDRSFGIGDMSVWVRGYFWERGHLWD